MNSQQVGRLVKTLLDGGYGEWQHFVDSGVWSASDLIELSRWADGNAVQAAQLAEYLDQRAGLGTSGRGHDEAIAKADKRSKKVRRAMGYAYP